MAKKNKINFSLASEVFEDASLSDTFVKNNNDNNNKNFVSISKLLSNPNQPRLEMQQSGIEELANSIVENGLLQAITVVDNFNDTFTIVFGHRRVAAYSILNKEKIEANILTKFDDKKMVISPIVENMQRKDMNPIETAIALDRVLKMNIVKTQEELSKLLGITQGRISKLLSILKLDDIILDKIAKANYKDVTVLAALNKISFEKQLYLFDKIILLPRNEALHIIKESSINNNVVVKKVIYSNNTIKINTKGVPDNIKKEVYEYIEEIENLLKF